MTFSRRIKIIIIPCTTDRTGFELSIALSIWRNDRTNYFFMKIPIRFSENIFTFTLHILFNMYVNIYMLINLIFHVSLTSIICYILYRLYYIFKYKSILNCERKKYDLHASVHLSGLIFFDSHGDFETWFISVLFFCFDHLGIDSHTATVLIFSRIIIACTKKKKKAIASISTNWAETYVKSK